MQAQQPDLHYPDVAARLFAVYEHKVMPSLEIEEIRIIGYATALADAFISQKKELHKTAKADPANAGKSLYSPLVISARHHNGSLQITWQEVHFVLTKDGQGRRKKFSHISKTANGTYNVANLKRRASYDLDLIEEYETRARELRLWWRQLMAIKKAVKNGIKRLPGHVPQLLEDMQAESPNQHIARSQSDFGGHSPASSL